MSMQIDRNLNIIINQGGIAHRTGFVLWGFQGMGDDLELSKGHGWHTASGHFTKQNGPTLWKGNRSDFNIDLFRKVTGWTPEQSTN